MAEEKSSKTADFKAAWENVTFDAKELGASIVGAYAISRAMGGKPIVKAAIGGAAGAAIASYVHYEEVNAKTALYAIPGAILAHFVLRNQQPLVQAVGVGVAAWTSAQWLYYAMDAEYEGETTAKK